MSRVNKALEHSLRHLPRWFRKVVVRAASRLRWWGAAEASATRSARTSWSWPRPAALAPRPSSRRCRPRYPRSSGASSMLEKVQPLMTSQIYFQWKLFYMEEKVLTRLTNEGSRVRISFNAKWNWCHSHCFSFIFRFSQPRLSVSNIIKYAFDKYWSWSITMEQI